MVGHRDLAQAGQLPGLVAVHAWDLAGLRPRFQELALDLYDVLGVSSALIVLPAVEVTHTGLLLDGGCQLVHAFVESPHIGGASVLGRRQFWSIREELTIVHPAAHLNRNDALAGSEHGCVVLLEHRVLAYLATIAEVILRH